MEIDPQIPRPDEDQKQGGVKGKIAELASRAAEGLGDWYWEKSNDLYDKIDDIVAAVASAFRRRKED
ncbi:hypothetical protein FWG95_03950 [Candidatus Saccharibacteria bacterium]|nr:hypothetical protein [Candidatus Saccharibacteria bacterium]